MRLLYVYVLPGLCLPVFGESCVVVLIELTRGIVRNVEQRNRTALRHALDGKSDYECNRDQHFLHHLSSDISSCLAQSSATRLALLLSSCAVPSPVSRPAPCSQCLPEKCFPEFSRLHRGRRETLDTKRDVPHRGRSGREVDRRPQMVRAHRQ